MKTKTFILRVLVGVKDKILLLIILILVIKMAQSQTNAITQNFQVGMSVKNRNASYKLNYNR